VITIRRARRSEYRRMLEIIAAFSPLDAELAKRDLKGEAYVAVEDRAILGTAGIIPDQLSPRVCWLGWTYFEPRYRSECDPFSAFRLWGRLLRHVEQIAADRGKVLFITTSSHPAYAHVVPFYERHGYKVAGTLPGYYAPGVDLVALCRKPLTVTEAMLDGVLKPEEKLRQLQAVLDELAAIFQEYGVIASDMAPEQCTQSLRRHLEDARKYHTLRVAPVFGRSLR
jgi:GNAT superfamily N-acetyltransferase